MNEVIKAILNWTNSNAGFLSLLIFATTILIGWISGIFQALRNKPKFRIKVLPGPSLCSTFETGRNFKSYPTTRTAISVYLNVVNVGSAPSDITDVHIGYHNYTFRHTFLWYWLTTMINVRADFRFQAGDLTKTFPFLIQSSVSTEDKATTYLEVGRSVNGIVYFEQFESWGGFCPRERDGLVKVKIRIKDAFGRFHKHVTRIPKVPLDQARKYNPEFGNTLEKLSESGYLKEEPPDDI